MLRFSFRDKRVFEITEAEITRVDCIPVCQDGFLFCSNNLWKAMEPVWTELAGSFEDSEDTIVASVDCKEFKELCKKHKVSIANSLQSNLCLDCWMDDFRFNVLFNSISVISG